MRLQCYTTPTDTSLRSTEQLSIHKYELCLLVKRWEFYYKRGRAENAKIITLLTLTYCNYIGLLGKEFGNSIITTLIFDLIVLKFLVGSSQICFD